MQEIEIIKENLEGMLKDPYPESIFPKLKEEDFEALKEFWEERTGRPIDALSADYGRIFRKGIAHDVMEALTALNQLEEKLNKEIEVERVIIAMYVSNGYDAWHRESDAYKEKLRTESKAAIAEINRQRNEQ